MSASLPLASITRNRADAKCSPGDHVSFACIPSRRVSLGQARLWGLVPPCVGLRLSPILLWSLGVRTVSMREDLCQLGAKEENLRRIIDPHHQHHERPPCPVSRGDAALAQIK